MLKNSLSYVWDSRSPALGIAARSARILWCQGLPSILMPPVARSLKATEWAAAWSVTAKGSWTYLELTVHKSELQSFPPYPNTSTFIDFLYSLLKHGEISKRRFTLKAAVASWMSPHDRYSAAIVTTYTSETTLQAKNPFPCSFHHKLFSLIG